MYTFYYKDFVYKTVNNKQITFWIYKVSTETTNLQQNRTKLQLFYIDGNKPDIILNKIS